MDQEEEHANQEAIVAAIRQQIAVAGHRAIVEASDWQTDVIVATDHDVRHVTVTELPPWVAPDGEPSGILLVEAHLDFSRRKAITREGMLWQALINVGALKVDEGTPDDGLRLSAVRRLTDGAVAKLAGGTP